jgi:hypothetical protein
MLPTTRRYQSEIPRCARNDSEIRTLPPLQIHLQSQDEREILSGANVPIAAKQETMHVEFL